MVNVFTGKVYSMVHNIKLTSANWCERLEVLAVERIVEKKPEQITNLFS
jgi:hypothetical protein